MNRLLCWLLVTLVFGCPQSALFAEKVADLPAPTGYVNDFAHVLSPSTIQRVDALCTQVDHQAGAQIAVVTINTLDDGETVEEFTVELEEKWKVGKKGTDKGLLMLIVLNPKKIRTEVGYGLEGALNDARVGDIQRTMVPLLSAGNYDAAVQLGVQDYARIAADDAGVTLNLPQTQPQYQYQRQSQSTPAHLGIGQVILGIGFLLLILIMIATGNGGWLWVILSMFLNGGGGGGGRRGGDGDSGGGFGGFGGGSSGGGGASSDF